MLAREQLGGWVEVGEHRELAGRLVPVAGDAVELEQGAAVRSLRRLLAGLPLGYHINGLSGALVAIVASSFAQWPIALWFRHQHKLNHWRNDIVLPIAVVMGLSLGWATTSVWKFLTA